MNNPFNINENNLNSMMNKINKMFQKDPEMVKTVSDCVNNIFENKDLMESIVTQINTNISPTPQVEVEDLD